MLGPEWLDATFIIKAFVGWIGPWAIVGVMLVIFAETGLLVGFFLPGDSLLFTLGMFVAIGETNPAEGVPVPIWVAAPLVWLAAVAGNQTGYLIGRKAGPAIFNKPDSRLFKQEYVDRTSDVAADCAGPCLGFRGVPRTGTARGSVPLPACPWGLVLSVSSSPGEWSLCPVEDDVVVEDEAECRSQAEADDVGRNIVRQR